MNKIIRNAGKSILTVALIGLLGSCSENIMDGINKDGDHPQDVEAKFTLNTVLMSTSFYIVGGDISTYVSTYIEHEAGVHNQLFQAERREVQPTSSTTYNNTWQNIYEQLRDIRVVRQKCDPKDGSEPNASTYAIAGVIESYLSAFLTDMFGDTPYSEASLMNPDRSPQFMTPKIDSQESIYKTLLEMLDASISEFEAELAASETPASVSSPVGSFDFLYSGNISKWLKFAYGLKARYTMRLIKTTNDVNGAMEKVIEYADKSFTTASEQAAFKIYNGGLQMNPLYDFFGSRGALGSSESMVKKLEDRNDPRLHRAFIDADGVQMSGPADGLWYPVPNGNPVEQQWTYNSSIFVYAGSAHTLWQSYHEILFLKAEALVRLKRTPEAQAVLKDAVMAAIANAEASIVSTAPIGVEQTSAPITSAEAADYFDNEVLPLFTANPLSEVMNQKYIAFFGASGEAPEAYNDIRRMMGLGENFVTLANPNNATKFPLRLTYGASDTTANPNVNAAYDDGQYVYSEPVWWAGGTR
jgi:hypothetical protein